MLTWLEPNHYPRQFTYKQQYEKQYEESRNKITKMFLKKFPKWYVLSVHSIGESFQAEDALPELSAPEISKYNSEFAFQPT